MNEEKGERQSAESFLEEELRYLDIDGSIVSMKNLIDSVLKRDRKKRRYATG